MLKFYLQKSHTNALKHKDQPQPSAEQMFRATVWTNVSVSVRKSPMLCCPLVFLFPLHRFLLLPVFHPKSCKTGPESRSMIAHCCSTANQWNSTNSTVICSLHPPAPPQFLLHLVPHLLFLISLSVRRQQLRLDLLNVSHSVWQKHLDGVRTTRWSSISYLSGSCCIL